MDSRHSLPIYPPDLQFGAAAAADQRRVDDLLDVIDALLAELPERRPRAGNRARSERPRPASLTAGWDWLRPGDGDGAPATAATALDAAPWINGS